MCKHICSQMNVAIAAMIAGCLRHRRRDHAVARIHDKEAVLECEQKRKPAIALACRFVRKVGCGCATCAGTEDQVELVLGLRKLELPDLMQDALARMTRAGQKVPTMVSIDVELKLEWTLAVWFSQFCCVV